MRSTNRRSSVGQLVRAELGKRDRRIVSDIVRYRLTTNDFVHQRHLSHAQPNAVVKVTGRLVRQGWLSAYPLLERQQYFVPGSKLVKLHGLPTSRARPLGPQSLASQYAVAKYCFTTGISVELATEAELSVAFPWLTQPMFNSPQLMEPAEGDVTLRLVRVDLGGTPEHVARKCMLDVASRQTEAEFNQLVAAKRFVLVVLTATAAKQELIQKAIAKRQWPKGMRFHVCVVPELAQLLSLT